MTHLTDDLYELFESIDSGILGDEELIRMFDAMEESATKRIICQGVELLRMLESINPDSVLGDGSRVSSKRD